MVTGPAEQLQKGSNHHVNPIRGDEHGLTAIEVEAKLRSKLRHNFEVCRRTPFKFVIFFKKYEQIVLGMQSYIHL